MSLVSAVGGPRALWYATRGTGVVSLLLLTAVVCLGIAGVRRLRGKHWPRFLVVGLHRNLTLLALAFIAIHVVTTVLDGYAPIGPQDAVVPFGSGYRPVWLGLGAVAFDLLLALTITSLVRARLGYRMWRALHWMAYAAWPIALVHALGTGSDARVGWMQLLGAGLAAVVAAAVLVRIAGANASPEARSAGAVALVLVLIGVLGWYATGPGRHGWSARAGTPVAQRPAVPAAAAPVLPSKAPRLVAAALPDPPYTVPVRGRLTSSQDTGGLVLVDLKGRTTRPADGVLWIRIQGRPVDGGGVAMTASGVSYGPRSAPSQYVGKIVSLRGTRLVLALRGNQGRLALHVLLRIDARTRSFTGTVAAT